MFVAFVYFGARICVSQTCKGLFYRVLALTSVCGLALSTKGAFFVAAAANAWRTDALFPSRSGRYASYVCTIPWIIPGTRYKYQVYLYVEPDNVISYILDLDVAPRLNMAFACLVLAWLGVI